jgi:hypothetical protein
LNVTDAILHFVGDGSALSHLNASNVDFGTLTTAVLPLSTVTPGRYGDFSNVSQVTIDQYGRVTNATNVAMTSSQWTGLAGDPIYYVPNVSIGAAVQASANLQVTGNVYVSGNVDVNDTLVVTGAMTSNAANTTFLFDTFTIPYINTQYLNVASSISLTGNLSAPLANITTLNVNYLTVDSAVIYGTSTLNVYGVSNLSTVTAQTMNVYGDCFIGNTAITGSVQTTTGPMSRLTFDNTANTSIYPNKIVLFANTASSQYCGFGVTGIGPTGGASISYGARANHIFYTGTTLNTEVMRVSSASTVGVGTTTPTAKFHVVGNIYASNAVTTTNLFASNTLSVGPGTLGSNVVVFSNISGGSNTFVMDSNGRVTIGSTYTGGSLLSFGQQSANKVVTLFDGNSADNPVLATNFYGFGRNTNVLRYQVNDNGAAHTFYGGSSEFTRITNTGIGILTGANPTSTLQVTGNAYISNSVTTTNVFANYQSLTGLPNSNVFLFSNVSGGSNVFGMDSNATVVIGIPPSSNVNYGAGYPNTSKAALVLNGAGSATYPITLSMLGRNSGIDFGGGGQSCAQIRNLYLGGGAGSLQFLVNNSSGSDGNINEKMRLTKSGLSINTFANPNSTLDVNGNVYISNAVTTTNLFANTLTMSNATSTINVTGNIYASNAVTTTNLFANTLTMSNAKSTINVTGNIFASNAVTTNNLFTAGITSNVTSTIFNSDTLTIPFVYSTTLNVASTSNLVTVEMQGSLGATTLRVTGNVVISNALTTQNLISNLVATGNVAPTIASSATIAPTSLVSFVSGTTAIVTITAPWPVSTGGTIMLIPTGLWTTTTAGNIALASTAVVSRTLHMTWDSGTTKWYPSY